MNESTMHELKILVERCDRRVHASNARKDRMRQEILSHLTDVFSEESERCVSEDEALQRTADRLGDPDQIGSELQASRRWIERTSFRPLRWFDRLRRSPGESALRFDCRMTLAGIGSLALFMPLFILVLGLVKGWQFSSPRAIPGFVLFIAITIIAIPIAVGIHHVRRTLLRASKPFATVGWVLVEMAFAAATIITTIQVINWTTAATLASATDPVLVGSSIVIGTIIFELSARLSLLEMTCFDEWESLKID